MSHDRTNLNRLASLRRLMRPADRGSALERWAIPALVLVASLVVVLLLERLTGAAVPLLVLVGIAATAWYLGLGAGLGVSILFALLMGYVVFRPVYSLSIESSQDQVRLASYVALAAVTSLAVSMLAHARRRDQALIEERGALVEELRETASVKDEFLGLVSHELKTPVTTVMGNAIILRDRGDTLDAEQIREATIDIASEAERLHTIIENLLVLARLDVAQPDAEPEPMLVARIVDTVVARKRKHAPRRQFILRESGTPHTVNAVSFYIEQTLDNLIANAMKYSPSGSAIEVEIDRSDEEVTVRVLDRGQGISPDEAERVFEPFFRSKDQRERTSGFGVGLTVCKRLIEIQGGRVWARPRAGGGSEFGFCLPCIPGASEPTFVADEQSLPDEPTAAIVEKTYA